MKTIKNQKITIIIFLFLLGVLQPTQAQFFKKLAKKAEEKVKQEAERRAERRVDKKIDKTFDKAETGIDGKIKKNPKNKTELPNTYNFEWKMTMQMQTKDGNVNMHYLLKQDATYFGIVLEIPKDKHLKDAITIMDLKNKTMMTLMNMEGNKVMRVIDIPNTDDNQDENVTIVETDTKKILGYLCQGYRIDTEEGIINMYVAINAPINFNKVLSNNSKFTPKGFNPNVLKKLKNGLMMEMDFVSKKKKKHNAKMTCIALDKNKQTINTKGYKSFGF